jgi:hypothetical protein
MIAKDNFRRASTLLIGAFVIAVLISFPASGWAQKTKAISIATGGTGGIYYVMGGGIAALLTKHIPNLKVTAESTAASIENALLIEAGKVDLTLILGSTSYDAIMGKERFKRKIPLRALGVITSNYIQFVALEGVGINSPRDLRGKRVSLGAPGSSSELNATRILEMCGIDPKKDIKHDLLSHAEGANAMKDRKIDAFNTFSGLPTPAILDLATTPGMKIKILDLEEIIPKLREKFGPVYYTALIPKGTYPGINQDVKTAATAGILACHEKMNEDLVYQIIKLVIEKKDELALVHKEALNISLQKAVVGSPIPYHPGAIRYYKEKGVTIQQ